MKISELKNKRENSMSAKQSLSNRFGNKIDSPIKNRSTFSNMKPNQGLTSNYSLCKF
jgi:hypothetical protein